MMYTNDKPVTKYRKDYKPNDFIIKKTSLDFKLFEDHVLLTSSLDIEKNPAASKLSPSLFLDGEQLEILEIKIDQTSLSNDDYEITEEGLKLFKTSPKFNLTTRIKLYPHKNTLLEGLYMSNGKFCTQCEAEGFRRITYYLDRPDNMSEFFVSIEADKNKYPQLLSNGNLLNTEETNNNRHIARWHDPFLKPSYLFALVAGDFDCLQDSFVTMNNRQVELKLFVDKGKLDQCRFAMDSLIKSMHWDEEKYGREYDLDLYMIVAVSDFNMGAMENKGLNVFNTAYVLAHPKTATDTDFEGVERVIAHEYFHNWTGNRITCRDWFQLSLKEGLTVFRDQQFSEDMLSPAVERINQVKVIRATQFAEDSGPMAHPIRPDSYIEMNNFYTVTVYNKGAEVIRMMHTLLGGSGFRSGMDLYFERHDGHAVTCEDYVTAMEDANQVDWTLFRHWYSQSGTPDLTVKIEQKSQNKITMHFEQACADSIVQKNKKPFMFPIKLGFIDLSGNGLAFKMDISNDEDNYSTGWLSEDIFVMNKTKQTIQIEFQLEQIKIDQIIPSLLRDFSAPVKLHYNYSNEQLACLFAHDPNSFNRWDAGQILMSQLLLSDSDTISQSERQIITNSISRILKDKNLDPALKSLAVQVPTLNSLIGEVSKIDFDKLVNKYRQLRSSIAKTLRHDWENNYLSLSEISFEQQTSGQRRLKNTALSYLLLADEEKYQSLAIGQQKNATNMTDQISALTAITQAKNIDKIEPINHFYNQWKEEELVLDKWFSAQAILDDESVLDNIKDLLNHKDFSIANPNKVRALIGTFVGQNTAQFNNATGSGYEFLSQMVMKLNKVNPQIGARLAKQFSQWRKFDTKRQALIEEQLTQILALDDLSKDIYEVVDRILAS